MPGDHIDVLEKLAMEFEVNIRYGTIAVAFGKQNTFFKRLVEFSLAFLWRETFTFITKLDNEN